MRGWTDPIKYLETLPSQPQLPMPDPTLYYIKPGDSLWKIALKFYGSGAYWPRIYNANKEKIKNPTLIFPFQRIVIP
jgi:nucleoid-associated protein YgaU